MDDLILAEACHWLWYQWDVAHTAPGRAFIDVIHEPYWNPKAKEMWCATLTAILVDRPGVWRQPISGAMPCKQAVWTFGPFLKEKP